DSADGVLALSESLEPRLAGLVASGALDAVELPSRYLPSLATQRARQVKLPSRADLERVLAEAGADLPFRSGLFEPFLDDLDAARTLETLTPAAFAKTPLGARLDAMLVRETDR